MNPICPKCGGRTEWDSYGVGGYCICKDCGHKLTDEEITGKWSNPQNTSEREYSTYPIVISLSEIHNYPHAVYSNYSNN